MKQIPALLLFIVSASNIHAQNVGIGVASPLNKLQVAGNIMVMETTVSSNTAPTPAQTVNMLNGNRKSFSVADSVVRIYDPGGPTGNYLANMMSEVVFPCCTPNHAGMEVSIENIQLGTGDSLIIKENENPGAVVFLAVGNGYNTPGRHVFNGRYFYILFKSNADAGVGSGFSILIKKLYKDAGNQPPVQGFAGNSFFFDTKNGSLRSGAIDNNIRSEYSVAMGEATRAGNHSLAVGFYAIATGGYSVATGTSTATGAYSSAFGSSTASGERSTAFSFATAGGSHAIASGGSQASGNLSTAMGSSTASGNTSTSMGGYTVASGSYSAATNYRTTSMGYAGTSIGMYNNPLLLFNQTSPTDNSPLFIIGNGNDEDNLSNAMVVRKDGKTGIGVNVPATRLHIDGGSDASVADASGHLVIGPVNSSNLVFDNNEIMARNNGSVSTLYLQNDGGALEIGGTAAKPGGGAWLATSDARLKQQISPYTDGLPQLLKINPVNFHYNEQSGYDTTQQHVGVLAQELKEVSPYMVSSFTKQGSEYYKVDNSAMTYMLINAVKEQQKLIELLEERIKKLEAKK